MIKLASLAMLIAASQLAHSFFHVYRPFPLSSPSSRSKNHPLAPRLTPSASTMYSSKLTELTMSTNPVEEGNEIREKKVETIKVKIDPLAADGNNISDAAKVVVENVDDNKVETVKVKSNPFDINFNNDEAVVLPPVNLPLSPRKQATRKLQDLLDDLDDNRKLEAIEHFECMKEDPRIVPGELDE